MPSGGSYQRQLFLSYFLPICACIIGLALFAGNRIHAIRIEGAQRTLWEETRLVYSLIEGDLRQQRTDAVRDKLRFISSEIGCRITVISSSGKVIADTEANPSEMENHLLRPEIVAASSQGEGAAIRFSHTVQHNMIYLARREQDSAGNIYFVRLSAPESLLSQNLKVFDLSLLAAALLAMGLAGASCYAVARRQSKPLAELSGLAGAIARGDISRRAHVEAGGELGQLELDLNAISATLAEIRSKAAKGRAELDAVLASMNDGVIATDLQQRILLANAAAGRLFNAKVGQAPGKMLWEVIQDEDVLKGAAQVASTGQALVVQSEPQRGRHLEISISPLVHDGRNDGVLIAARDSTQNVTYQELRKEFVANVSHELRTPLTFIKGYVEMLRDGASADPEKAAGFLAVVEKHVEQLTNLVDDLLEISKLESRAGLPRRVSINVPETVGKIADFFAPALARKEQKLSVELPKNFPTVSGDPDYLERAISNLLDNAIKYTPEKGTIRISGSALDSRTVIEVSDTGIGIPAKDLPRIFERFYRVDKSRSREMGGTGLGLSIVKHIAQAHGGSVEVSSEPGKGTTFRIVLPSNVGVES